MHHIFLVLFLFISSLTSASAQTKLNSMLTLLDIPTGQDRAATTTVIQTTYSRAIAKRIRSANEPVRKAELRAEEQKTLRKLGTGFTDTTEHKGIYRLSPIAGFVAVGPGSSVLEETTLGIKRWHLFFNDKLYGLALSLEDKGAFSDQVAGLSEVFGKPSSFIKRKGSEEVSAVTWDIKNNTYVLRNFKTEFGVLLLVKLDTESWKEVQKVTSQNLSSGPKDKQSADKLLEEVLR